MIFYLSHVDYTYIWFIEFEGVTKAIPNPAQRKRKRISAIEDSCGDPYTFRAPRRRALV